MPSIRLIDIPNAPGAGSPNLQRGVASMPDMPSVPRDAAMDASSLARGAASLRERPVDSGAINAGILALQGLGQAVKEAAGVPADFSLRLQKAQNTADIARADVIMRDAFASQQERMQGMPEDKWEETWKTEGLKSVREQIDKLGLSQAVRDQITPDLIQWEGATSIQIRTQSTKQKINEGKTAVLNAANRAKMDGHFESSIALLRDGEEAGLFTPQETESIVQGFELELREEADMGILNSSPRQAKADLDEAMKTGESKLFPHATPDKIRRYRAIAENNDLQMTQDKSNALDEMVFSGSIKSEEEIYAYGEQNGFSQKLTASHVAAFNKIQDHSPEGIAKTLESHSRLMTDIEAYDPSKDPQAKGYISLQMAIRHQMPEGSRETLLMELRERKKEGVIKPDATTRANVFSQIDKQASLGVFGPLRKRKNDKKDDPILQSAVFQRALDLKEQFRDWYSENPKATSNEIGQWFKDQTAKDIIKSGVKLSGEDAFNYWNLIPAVGAYNLASGAVKQLSGQKTKEELIREVEDALVMPTIDDDPNDIIP